MSRGKYLEHTVSLTVGQTPSTSSFYMGLHLNSQRVVSQSTAPTPASFILDIKLSYEAKIVIEVSRPKSTHIESKQRRCQILTSCFKLNLLHRDLPTSNY